MLKQLNGLSFRIGEIFYNGHNLEKLLQDSYAVQINWQVRFGMND